MRGAGEQQRIEAVYQFEKDARAVADGVAAADLRLSIGAEEGGRGGSCSRRGRKPELRRRVRELRTAKGQRSLRRGGAWRMEEDDDPQRHEFQIRGSLVLFPVSPGQRKPQLQLFRYRGSNLHVGLCASAITILLCDMISERYFAWFSYIFFLSI